MKLNKLFITVIVLFSISSQASANRAKQPMVIITPGGGRIILPSTGNKDELKGKGLTFNSTVKVTTEKNEEGKPVKKYESWVRGCGTVELPPEGKEKENISSGERIELRFDRAGSCNVIDWKKF